MALYEQREIRKLCWKSNQMILGGWGKAKKNCEENNADVK
jgi:hypothetical protein